ncbi:NADPH:quinone oxidoreductase family protein [Orrella sp. 11846]|uniref:NADPH:quinone oxidoreductase family protein n=1 Tax=Orrella sp. 11846 TaxID=3409913 RepID=UPI003B5BD499
MKAIVCQSFGDPRQVAKVEELPMPGAPAHNEVTIDVAYATVSHATELLIRGTYQSDPPLPFSPGTEVYGRIVACGADVVGLKPGDRVVAMRRWGGYAQRINCRATTVYRVPEALSWQQALPLPLSYGTAYSALVWKAQITPQDQIVVLGAGSGVGLAAVEIASTLGAQVIAVASSEEKRQLARAHGAHLALSSADENLVQKIKTETEGGASIIFDPVGAQLMEQVFKSTAQGAQILSIGFAAGRPPKLPQNIMLVKNLTLHGFFYGQYIGWTPTDQSVRYETQMRGMMRALQQLAIDGRIRPEIVKTYEIDALCAALDDLNERRVTGKIAITINGDLE